MTQRTRDPLPGALSALGRSVSGLWHDPEPRVGRPRDLLATDAPGTAVLVAVPRASSARLLVPASPASAAAGAVSRYSCALTARERLTRVTLAAGLRVGGTRLLPDGLGVRDGGLVAHLADVLGEPVVVSMGIGTDRANRKPVLEVFDRRGRSLAFVKVGDTDVARRHVEGEEAALRLVATGWDVVRVPQVLHAGDWQGLRVLVVSTLATSPWTRPRAGLVDAAQDEVFSVLGTSRGPVQGSASWTDARTAVAQHPDDAPAGERCADRFAAAVEALEERLPDRDVALGSWHGDWTPWNMCPVRRRLHVWDWERFATGAPAGLDRVHHEVNVATRAHGTTIAVVQHALSAATSDELVRSTYLVSVTARYLSAAADDGGAAIRPRAQVFLDALEHEAGTEPEHPSSHRTRRQAV